MVIRNHLGLYALVLAAGVACNATDPSPAIVTQSLQTESTLEVACNGNQEKAPRFARHVIVVVADGMQLEHEIAASRYLYGTDNGMAWRQLPEQGYVATWDVTTYDKFAALAGAPAYDAASFDPLTGYDPTRAGTKPYPLQDPADALTYYVGGTSGATWWPATDSASAATAMSTGYKTDDGNVAWLPGDPENGALPTITERLRAERGFAIGVVSTQPLSHATPAAFLSHNVNRNHFYTGRLVNGVAPAGQGIADEIVFETKPEVLITGGHPLLVDSSFSPASNTQSAAKGFVSTAAYNALTSDEELVFTERQAGIDGGETLAAAVQTAVNENKRLVGLFGSSSGAFDFAVPTDTPTAPSVARGSIENPTLAQAAVGALQVLRQDPEGFFLMVEQGDIDTANHANNYKNMIGSMTDLERAVQAILGFVDEPGDDIHWDNTVLLVVADHATGHLRLNPSLPLGLGDLPAQEGTKTYPDGDVSWSTGGHSNELVTYSGKGPHLHGALRGLTSPYGDRDILDNTQLNQLLLRAAGVN